MRTQPPLRGLYVIVDPAACGERSPVEIAREALAAGATMIQWRDKRRDKGDQLADARAIAELCRQHRAIFIVNDHADLAAAAGADGVHVGQRDLPLTAARALLGPMAIIGVSTNNPDEAREAEIGGASYIAVGAIYPTASKDDTRPANLDRIRDVKAAVHVPVVAIGGINADNIADVVAAGADAAAVISAVCGAKDVRAASATLAAAFPKVSGPMAAREKREEMRTIVVAFVNALNARDKHAFLDLFTVDGVIQDPVGEPAHSGRSGISAWWDEVVDRPDPFTVHARSTHIAGEEAALVWSIDHLHNGSPHTAAGVEILSFDGDLISSCHSYWSASGTPQTEVREVINEYERAVEERDRAAYLDLLDEHAVQQNPVGSAPLIGKTAIGAWWNEMIVTYPGYSFTIGHIAQAGREAAVPWHVTYEIGGASKTGSGVDIIGFDERHKIVAVHSYWEAEDEPFATVRGSVLDDDQARARLTSIASRFIDVLNNRDREGFMSLFVPDCVVQVPQHSEPFVGYRGLESWWDETIPGRPFRIRLDGVHPTREEVAVTWTNVDETPGSTTSLRGIEILAADGERISSVSSYRTRGHEPDPRPRAVALAFTDALNARDREAFLALWAVDGMRQDPPDMLPIIGIEAIGRAFDEMLVQFPDYTMGVETICVAGNEAAIAWRTENRSGDTPVIVEGVVVLALDGAGKIASLHAYWHG